MHSSANIVSGKKKNVGRSHRNSALTEFSLTQTLVELILKYVCTLVTNQPKYHEPGPPLHLAHHQYRRLLPYQSENVYNELI